MPGLAELDIGHNLLSGKIPEGIGNLTKMFSCHLEDNNFSGELPSSMGNMAWLNWLNMSSNNFVGVIPQEFANLKMSSLNLYHNKLTG